MTRTDVVRHRPGGIGRELPPSRGAPHRAGSPVPQGRTPPRQRFPVLARPTLVTRLSEAAGSAPLTVVWAPAGAGKTTLAATWAAHASSAVDVTWTTLDPDGAGSRELDAQLVRALDHPDPRTSTAAVPHPRPHDRVLVVDNAERLTDPQLLDRLDRLVEDTRCGLHVVLLSRAQPSLPLHRYRIDGSVAELDYDDLSFDDRDAIDLLRLHGVHASAATARLLVARTGGWVAGIRIAALAMQEAASPLSVAEMESCLVPANNLMADYLLAEVVQPMSDAERMLLADSCVHADLDASLVDRLTGGSDGERVLGELARRHAFVRREGPTTYRVHPLLRRALYEKLRLESPGSVREAHRRAFRWYAGRGDVTTAVEHGVLAGSWAEVATLVLDGGLAALLAGADGGDLARRLDGLPREADAPGLAVVRTAAALRLGDLGRARALLGGARPTSRSVAVDRALQAVTAAVHRAADEPAAAAAAAARAGTVEPPGADADDGALRALLLRTQAEAALRAGRHPEACALSVTAVTACAGPAAEEERRRCLGVLALSEAARGRLSDGLDAADRAEGSTEATAAPASAAAELARAWVSVRRRNPAAACRILAGLDRDAEVDPFLAWAARVVRAQVPADPAAALARPTPETVGERDLSAKELEVLSHLAGLLTTEEIAAVMFISVNTVKTHVRSILRKLAVSRRNQAVRRARQLGLV